MGGPTDRVAAPRRSWHVPAGVIGIVLAEGFEHGEVTSEPSMAW